MVWGDETRVIMRITMARHAPTRIEIYIWASGPSGFLWCCVSSRFVVAMVVVVMMVVVMGIIETRLLTVIMMLLV